MTGSRCLSAQEARAPHILLRSSWQVVNIGDIAHTPGVLALIEKYIPEAEVILWASDDLSAEVAAMEHHRFPKLKIVKGTIKADDVAAYVKHTGKPFGVYGITHGSFLSGDDKSLLSKAQFVYFRDSVSLARAKEEGVSCPVMEFAPDGAFACDLRDDAKATEFLDSNHLEEGKFLCCLSRLRYTPYWSIPGSKRPYDEKRYARNEAMKEHDHAPIREAIVSVIRATDLKILLCPEDMTQMAVGKEMLFDKLPDDVKSRVVWKEKFWLTDMALSVYVRSAGLFGSEMHSPIMAVGNGIPAIVCRFEEQTSKGIMWRDIGLGDWLFDFDNEDDCSKLPAAVLALAKDPITALERTQKAREFVTQRQSETMLILKNLLIR